MHDQDPSPNRERHRPADADPSGGPVPVAAVHDPEAPPATLLERALEASGFWTGLEVRCRTLGRQPDSLAVVVKPDLDATVPDDPGSTDPFLVEALVALLRSRGYPRVTVLDGRNRPDRWLHNRDALALPDLAGYRFEAPPGDPYDVAWVEDAPRPVPLDRFDGAGALRVDGAWVDADVRITFGSAKTDDAWGYALTVQNLLGLIAPSCPAAGWAPEDRCLHLLRRVPPDFAILDAVVSSHGSRGSEAPRPLHTGTVVASPSALLVDWVGALKMGLDPHVAPTNASALERLGLPDSWTLEGDTVPWEGWEGPHPTLLESTATRRRLWPALDELARAALRPTDRELFPFRHVLLDQVNARVLSALERVAGGRPREAALGALAWGLAWLARARHALVTSVAKDRIVRSRAPLSLELEELDPAAFDETVEMVETQARVLDGAPEDARGLRLRTIGGHIHFAASRVLPLDFDAFVERVEIGAAIRYMNDYLGGSWRVVADDDRARPLRQAERNVYLPQPNWVGVFGGREIDVEKLERIVYEEDRHVIWWRTVRSPNGSADSDDGSVAFVRTPASQVEVRVFARQRFRLPDPLASARVERWPGLHGELVSEAYGRFFDGTLANLQAAYRGEEYRIGKPPPEPGEAAAGRELRAVLSGALALVSRILGWAPAEPETGGESGGTSGETRVQPVEVDDLGFAHFAGSDAPAHLASGPGWEGAGGTRLTPLTFLTELGQAVGRDLAAASIQAIPLGSEGAGAPSRPGATHAAHAAPPHPGPGDGGGSP